MWATPNDSLCGVTIKETLESLRWTASRCWDTTAGGGGLSTATGSMCKAALNAGIGFGADANVAGYNGGATTVVATLAQTTDGGVTVGAATMVDTPLEATEGGPGSGTPSSRSLVVGVITWTTGRGGDSWESGDFNGELA
jgi:hypothetical protein